ncbi:uncharacterized protein TNCV_1622861 [Trichonephila clavipes]|nr:uncharacterized protein TNCV_1622861 [Trichonephila clavipes]
MASVSSLPPTYLGAQKRGGNLSQDDLSLVSVLFLYLLYYFPMTFPTMVCYANLNPCNTPYLLLKVCLNNPGTPYSQTYEGGGCQGQSKAIVCSGSYRAKQHVLGLTANAPLFTDITMEVNCKDEFNDNIFEMDIPKTAYKPFSGELGCKDGQTITGIDICFEGDLKYVAIECNTLTYNFKLEGSVEKSGNSKATPAKAACPSDKAMISLQLHKDEEGNIEVSIKCDKIVRK